MEKNNISKSKQLENFFNSITEDIFNADEKEIDEMLVELGYDPKKVGDSSWQLIKNLQKLKGSKMQSAIKLKSRVVAIEIGKEYYWQRELWRPAFSGMVKIVKEGGSHRVKGWQVEYVDKEKQEVSNIHWGLPIGTYTTHFADDCDLFEVVNE